MIGALQIIQVAVATMFGVVVLLMATQYPKHYPLTDNPANRIVLSAFVTLVVMMFPICHTYLIDSLIMLFAGTVLMNYGLNRILGPTPYVVHTAPAGQGIVQHQPTVIDARPPRGYRQLWFGLAKVRVAT